MLGESNRIVNGRLSILNPDLLTLPAPFTFIKRWDLQRLRFSNLSLCLRCTICPLDFPGIVIQADASALITAFLHTFLIRAPRMSPQQVPALRNGATDIDSDSDYLGTPVDPPASCQPYVAEYAPLTNYYYSSDTYDGPEYAAGRSGDHLGLPASSEYGGPSPSHGLLLQTPYPVSHGPP